MYDSCNQVEGCLRTCIIYTDVCICILISINFGPHYHRWLQAYRLDLIFPHDYNFSLAYDKVQAYLAEF